tara:strand:+ start:1721 stop:1873 length:153 start_codon:yes stop_codon:yes gene_type:complete
MKGSIDIQQYDVFFGEGYLALDDRASGMLVLNSAIKTNFNPSPIPLRLLT